MLSRVRNHFQGAKFARMSSGTYCVIRDLGLVKGGKGMRHHEVLVTFSPRLPPLGRDAGRDLASAVKRRWLSHQREPQRFETDVPTNRDAGKHFSAIAVRKIADGVERAKSQYD